jgi:hypothetical protein
MSQSRGLNIQVRNLARKTLAEKAREKSPHVRRFEAVLKVFKFARLVGGYALLQGQGDLLGALRTE